jgi:hypothetical protein
MADTCDHAAFGHLTRDGLLNCWLGGVDLTPDLYVEIAVSGTDEDRFLGFPAARDSLAWLRSHELDARRQVATEMVELYNDCWTDEDEPITVEEFARRIDLLRASLGEDGSVLLSYSDGSMSMFGGHMLDADFGPDKTYRGTMLIG